MKKKKKKIISNAGFSQLLSYANNMVEFKLEKDIIKRVIDKFSIKYQIDKSLVEAIYNNTGVTGEIDMNAYNPEEDKNEEDEEKNEESKNEEEKNEESKNEEIKNEESKNEEGKNEENKNEESKNEE